MNKKFLLTILTLSVFLLADNQMGKNDISNKMWAKMKMGIAGSFFESHPPNFVKMHKF